MGTPGVFVEAVNRNFSQKISREKISVKNGYNQGAWVDPVEALLSKKSGKPDAKIKQVIQSLNDEALFEISISDLVQ